MSEQGKILSWKEWVEKTFTETYANRVLCGFTRDESPLYEYENYKIKKELTTAETAATEYAKQAAELQERNEELQRKLNHNCPYCPSWQEENTVLIHQVTDFESEVETYKEALVLSHKDTAKPEELDFILAALRKARGE